MNQQDKNTDKMSRRASRLRILGLSLILLSLVAFIYFSTTQHKELINKDIVISQKDSVLSQIQDSSIKVSYKEDSLIAIVNQFLRLRKAHEADSLENLYSDTVIKYFKDLNFILKSVITSSEKKYWIKYPHDKFTVMSPIKIFSEALGYRAIFDVKECNTPKYCIDEIWEIRFDSNLKINYVRAYLAK